MRIILTLVILFLIQLSPANGEMYSQITPSTGEPEQWRSELPNVVYGSNAAEITNKDTRAVERARRYREGSDDAGFWAWGFSIFLFLAFFMIPIIGTVDQKKLFSKCFASDENLLKIIDNCINISEDYFDAIALSDPIHKKIYISEVIQAVIVNSLSMFIDMINSKPPRYLIKGLSLMNKEIVKTYIPTVTENYINSCYYFRINQYKAFYYYTANSKLYKHDEIKKNNADLHMAALAQLEVFYNNDIMFFQTNTYAIPIVNESAFKKLHFTYINLDCVDADYKCMIIKLQQECVAFAKRLYYLNANIEKIYRKYL